MLSQVCNYKKCEKKRNTPLADLLHPVFQLVSLEKDDEDRLVDLVSLKGKDKRVPFKKKNWSCYQ